MGRPWFSGLREMRDKVAGEFPAVRELSMGMSNDFEVAIEEGATILRVGFSALWSEARVSLKMKKAAFIGAGNMAEAMVRGLLASGSFKKKDITLLRHRPPERLSYLSSQYGVATTSDNREAVKKSDIVIFSVKPPGNPCGLHGK